MGRHMDYRIADLKSQSRGQAEETYIFILMLTQREEVWANRKGKGQKISQVWGQDCFELEDK